MAKNDVFTLAAYSQNTHMNSQYELIIYLHLERQYEERID